jgi:hypothetical protein
MTPEAIRTRNCRARQAAGRVVAEVEVREAHVEGLELARLLPAQADHTRRDLARAIERLLDRLLIED